MLLKTALTRLHKEFQTFYKDCQAGTVTGLQVANDTNDALVWHFILYDFPSDTPYHGGCYHGIMTYPKNYPYAPPNLKMCTPSGRFEVNKSLCFTMSDFHPETWNPTWNMRTILLGLYSFMLDAADPTTTGSIRATSAERKKLASESLSFNLQDPRFRALFPEWITRATAGSATNQKR